MQISNRQFKELINLSKPESVEKIQQVIDQPVEVTYYQRKTVLTDAQIKALPTTYQELAPAPGENKMLVFHSALCVLNTSAGGYTGQSADEALLISYGDWDKETSTIVRIPITATRIAMIMSRGTIPDGRESWAGYLRDAMYEVNVTPNLNNMPLKLIGSNGGSDYTGGNAANTLSITVFYSIVDL